MEKKWVSFDMKDGRVVIDKNEIYMIVEGKEEVCFYLFPAVLENELRMFAYPPPENKSVRDLFVSVLDQL